MLRSLRIPLVTRGATAALAAAIALTVAPGQATAAAPGERLLTEPFVPMFTDAQNCRENIEVNNLSGAALDARLDDVDRWYDHVHAEASNKFLIGSECKGASPTSLASKLTARGITASQYRNGSYVSQSSPSASLNIGEAVDLEKTAPLSIATFWAGDADTGWRTDDANGGARLAVTLDPSTTTVRVTPATADRPNGAPATWPFMNSRGTGLQAGAYSTSTYDVVSWVRIDNEIMQIVEEPRLVDGQVVLKVRRGIWGTRAASHSASTKVTSPVYIGSTSAHPSDNNLSGSPIRQDPNFPLRYGLKLWQPASHTWIARQITRSFGPDLGGHDTVWLDVSSCATYNNADAWGLPIKPYDDRVDSKLTRDGYGEAQRLKLAGLRKALPGVKLMANNLAGSTDACNRDLMANHVDGGVLENWLKTDGNWPLNWPDQMKFHLDIQQNNWPGIYWVRPERAFTGDRDAYMRFAYGSLLLGYEPSNSRFQFGGPFGLSKPDQLFFWDFGTPLTTASTSAEMKVGSGPLHRRDYTHGVVVVNPSDSAASIQLDAPHWAVPINGDPYEVTRATVGAWDAVFLMRQQPAPAPSPGPSPDPDPDPDPGADTTAPSVTVTDPAADATVTGSTVTAAGTAADDQKLAKVEVAVMDRATKQWLRADGTWGGWTIQDATVSPDGGWQARFDVNDRDQVGLLVRAVDAAGNRSEWTWRAFSVAAADTTAPTVAVTAPGSTVPAGAVTIAGTAADDRGPVEVQVAVMDRATRQWLQPGGGWGGWAVRTQTVDATGGWQVSIDPGTRTSLGVLVTAIDAAGNTSANAWHAFEVEAPDTTAPSVSITTPGTNETVRGTSLTVAGRANDDRKVAAVKVAVMDRGTRQWLQPNGTWGGWATLDASLDASGAWRLTVSPGSRSNLGVLVHAEDAAGNRSANEWRAFTYRR